MEYQNISYFADKWGLTERNIRYYCSTGRINGAFLKGKTWFIPIDASKPNRKKRKDAKNFYMENNSYGGSDMVNKLINLLNKTYTQYHTVDVISKTLDDAGYIELKENECWVILPGCKYYVTRGDSSIVVFNIPSQLNHDYHYQVIASHSDSPTFKLKPNPILVENGFVKLNVEKYGGMIYSSWLDRPLTIAGRVMVEDDNKVITKLVYIDKNLLTIPNVAIHMNRDINSGFSYNPQVDLLPTLAEAKEEVDYFKELMLLAGIKDKVLAFDLYLVSREKASLSGLNNEFISAPKLDNLECAYVTLNGLLNSKENNNVIPVYTCFDNEEVGSSSINGAGSTLLKDVLDRLSMCMGLDKEEALVALSKSFVISADNAHGLHPNHPEFSDPTNKVRLNKGIVIKYNANMKYCSDSYSSAALKLVLDKSNIAYQEYTNKSNMPGGSTLGNILQGQVSVHMVDIGLPQLAMHSSYEVAGSKDIDALLDLSTSFYSGDLILSKELEFKL